MLRGKNVVLGVTGGIAAYKAAELLRLLVRQGARVHVIMTRAAAEFVTPLTFQTLSSNPVHMELFNLRDERDISHISLADCADLFVVAPATANLIGKIAGGIADDLLSTTIMATKAPVLFAPAMNTNMYRNPIYRENEEKLRRLGYLFADPVSGQLACGWEGEGKLQDPAIILEEAVCSLCPKDLAGERVLVTAGPTREELDPVRYLSNHSSGKMGYAIARAARRRGARVTLVTGPVCLAEPFGVETISVVSAAEMREAVVSRFAAASIVIKAAAVADFRPEARAGSKIKKSAGETVLRLARTGDILAEIGRLKNGQFIAGFAAETDDLGGNAVKKLKEKNLDMIVANDVTREGAGFAVDTNIVTMIFSDGRVEDMPLMDKETLADTILDRIAAMRRQSPNLASG
jgi:phosphopantothenoylcysteine decarboxylase/phosphopantothenate--cysteine ligase